MCHPGDGGVCSRAETKRNIIFILNKMLGKQHIVDNFIRKSDCKGKTASPNSKHMDSVLGKTVMELYFAK